MRRVKFSREEDRHHRERRVHPVKYALAIPQLAGEADGHLVRRPARGIGVIVQV
jgi:hypothetical protein